MLRVGLTGGIASGKSAVARRLARHGAVVIDADVLAREVVRPGTPALAAITERFGRDVLYRNGRLNRPVLGSIVFADPKARADLNAIVHPAVRARGRQIEAKAPPGAVVVHVIPLLVETGQADDFDVLVVVDADPETQIARMAGRDGLGREPAQARLDAQASRQERLDAADIVIANDGTLADLERRTDEVWRRLVEAGNNASE